jgi:hypothetical protein
MRVLTTGSAVVALIFATPVAVAHPLGPATFAGRGRITCRGGTMCVLGIGDPAQIEYQVDVDALPATDEDRLSKQCVVGGGAPCVVTVQGTEMDDPLKVKAMKITWYN